jgi:hypothetical protein
MTSTPPRGRNRIDQYLEIEESLGRESVVLLRDLGTLSLDAFESIAIAYEKLSSVLEQTPKDRDIVETARSAVTNVSATQLQRLNSYIRDPSTNANRALRTAGDAWLAMWARYAQKIVARPSPSE